MSNKLDELLIFRKIPLHYPIKDGHGNEITELNVRRAKGKDIRLMSQRPTEGEQNAFIMAQLTGLVMEDIDELDAVDYIALTTAIGEMLKVKMPLA